jgi:dipeptidyl aminopeptidase/acylaminoacyl peptidase
VTLFHGLYRCAAAVNGLYDLVPLVQDGTTQTMRLARSLVGIGSRYDPIASALSPVKLAAQADAPVLLVRDDSDLNRPNDQSRAMAAALKAAGKPVDELVLPGRGGAVEAQANGIATIKALVAFVERNDPPDPGATAVQATN